MTFLPPRIKRASGNGPDEFFAKVATSGDCWLWLGALTPRGYGTFSYRGKKERAHRVMFEWAFGPIPDGKVVLHSCDVRRCVRPQHLRLGTQGENVADMMAKGRHVAAKGEACGAAKLTEDEVRAIRAEEGSAGRVGSLYGVSKSLILAIRRNEVWRHI